MVFDLFADLFSTSDCDNSVEDKQFVTTVDTISPTLDPVEHIKYQCGTTEPEVATATGSDTCSDTVTIGSAEATVTLDSCMDNTLSTKTITWTATDDCGNTASLEQYITQIDTLAPELSVPMSRTLECGETVPDLGFATATDTCDADVDVILEENNDIKTTCGADKVVSVLTRSFTATE